MVGGQAAWPKPTSGHQQRNQQKANNPTKTFTVMAGRRPH